MKQNKMIWAVVTVAAVGLSVYLVRKKMKKRKVAARRRTRIYSRGKMHGGGEFVL